MVVVVFRSRLRADAPADYPQLAERMLSLARAQPGFRSFKSFRAEDGERLSLIEFESEEAERAWRDHPEHRLAQRRGRAEFYAEYRLQVCEPLRERRHPG
jgi:heme-degrading monooxygenase HmoA